MQVYNTIVLNNLTLGTSEANGTLYVGGTIVAGKPLSVNFSSMPDGLLGGSLVIGRYHFGGGSSPAFFN